MATGALRPFGAQYRKTVAQHGGGINGYECCVCGKRIDPARSDTFYVAVNNYGADFAPAGCDPDAADYMGWYPIGPDCYRRYRKQFGHLGVTHG